MNSMKYFVDTSGVYLGGWDANPPDGAIEVPIPPVDARQAWDGQNWSAVPATNALTQPINRIQFEFMIEKLGVGTNIQQAIEAMQDGDEKILARVLFRSGQEFVRSHTLFTQLAPAVGLSELQIDDAWVEAANLTW